MKKLLLALLYSGLFILSANASESNRYAAGRSGITASAGLGYSSATGWILHMTPRYNYYIANRLGIGLDSDFYFKSGYSRLGVGPSANLHVLIIGNWDLVVGQNVLYTKESNQTPGIIGTTGGGINYALSPHLSASFYVGKMYYLTKEHIKPEDDNIQQLALVYQF